jgi:RNA polymerase sigma-70 factor (ECF subfamily)
MPPQDTEAVRWFKDEIQPHDAQLKAYLRGSFPSVRDVEDVVQESYLRVWRAQAVQTITCARGFLYQIARHVALDLLRHERTSPIEAVTDLAALRVSDERPDAATVADAIDALPARCREIFILRKIKRLPQKEIARQLGLSEQTVQVQVQRGMRRCEAYLAQRGL